MKILRKVTSVSLKPRVEKKLLRLYFPADKLINHWGVEGDNMERHSTRSHFWEEAQDRTPSLEYLGTSLCACLTSSRLLWRVLEEMCLGKELGESSIVKTQARDVFQQRASCVWTFYRTSAVWLTKSTYQSFYSFFSWLLLTAYLCALVKILFSPEIKMIWKVQVLSWINIIPFIIFTPLTVIVTYFCFRNTFDYRMLPQF